MFFEKSVFPWFAKVLAKRMDQRVSRWGVSAGKVEIGSLDLLLFIF